MHSLIKNWRNTRVLIAGFRLGFGLIFIPTCPILAGGVKDALHPVSMEFVGTPGYLTSDEDLEPLFGLATDLAAHLYLSSHDKLVVKVRPPAGVGCANSWVVNKVEDFNEKTADLIVKDLKRRAIDVPDPLPKFVICDKVADGKGHLFYLRVKDRGGKCLIQHPFQTRDHLNRVILEARRLSLVD